MKIGIISDIHGAIDQLNKALKLLEQHQVDQMICAGDLVDFGTDSIGVVNRILSAKIPCVAGNHDQDARHNQPLRQRQVEQGFNLQLFDEYTLMQLERLPVSLNFEWDATTILLTHANPWFDNRLYVFPHSPLPLFRRVIREGNADIIILGHTHEPMHIEIEGKYILNPGSVAGSYELGFGTCGLLKLPQMEFQILNIETGFPFEEYAKAVY